MCPNHSMVLEKVIFASYGSTGMACNYGKAPKQRAGV